MNDTDVPSSDSSTGEWMDVICSNGSNTEECKNREMVIFILEVDGYIDQIFYPLTIVFIVIGTILNLLSLYCFLKMNKRNSQNVYLFVLSLGDIINLHINFSFPMLRKFVPLDTLFLNSHTLCCLFGVLTEFFLIFPTWIVVLLTISRLITILWPSKHDTPFKQTRAKISILILAAIVLCLSLYRLIDLKGIDQVSVFSVTACEGGKSIEFIRNVNLMIWTILPECLTFIVSLIIVYQIQSVGKNLPANHSRIRQVQYNQVTRTVLLISILFLIFHTPTGIMIAIDLVFGSRETILGIIILVSRKLTIFLYEISLCCKFFIYYQTLRDFKVILSTLLFHFTRRRNSAKLGRRVLDSAHDRPRQRTVSWSRKQSITYPTDQNESLTINTEEYQSMLDNHHSRTNSTNLSRTNREQQSSTVLMNNNTEDAHVTLPNRLDLLRECSKENNRILIPY